MMAMPVRADAAIGAFSGMVPARRRVVGGVVRRRNLRAQAAASAAGPTTKAAMSNVSAATVLAKVAIARAMPRYLGPAPSG